MRVLREEIHALLADHAALVQLDEPVLAEVVFTGAKNRRSFMCGALSEKGETGPELEFATDLISQTTAGLPADRLALHVCRGNWTRDESAALSGDYRRLLPVFERAGVGALLLEACTPRTGDLGMLRDLLSTLRLGVGMVNQKHDRIESVEEVLARARAATALLGPERIWLTPACGFATFADSPVASAGTAEAKLRVLAAAAAEIRKG